VLLSLYSPSSTADRLYHLSQFHRFALQLTIVVPLIIIWFVALWGAITFRTYANIIQGSPESRGLSLIANGLMWLLVYLVTLSLGGVLLPYFAQTSWVNTFVVLRNHLPVISSLIGFGLLCLGSLRLRVSTPFRVWTRGALVLVLLMSALAGVFVWLFLMTESPLPRNGVPAYVLSKETLVFTLVLPYCWSWFLGLLAALNLTRYARRVNGIIYRQAIRDLAWGVAGAVVMVASIQLITLSSRFLTRLELGALLLVVYVLLAICAVGFLLVRSGARKLTRIEVVR
jgi:hypothetical protein